MARNKGNYVCTGPGGLIWVKATTGSVLAVSCATVERTLLMPAFTVRALAPDEILTEIRLPKMGASGWGFEKLTKRAQDWAIVGAVAVKLNGGPSVGVSLINIGSVPVRASAVEAAVSEGAPAADAASLADSGLDVVGDANASESFRRHLSRVLVRRALTQALA